MSGQLVVNCPVVSGLACIPLELWHFNTKHRGCLWCASNLENSIGNGCAVGSYFEKKCNLYLGSILSYFLKKAGLISAIEK
jgi:hypothetical protein